ncbi:MAG: hypothetical protein JST52_00210 [Bacteroidetes bacterium]|nr:hypothetical protein [Bacteroidota bacterium]MBS1739538.1 hypothetical protein [Bacteroidota bacterium]MBS1777439.1 hypothetical protein [Bacteroidota bacterium]
MTRRNKTYLSRQKSLRRMTNLSDLTSFLMAGFGASRSMVVKKDILNMLITLRQPLSYLAVAS